MGQFQRPCGNSDVSTPSFICLVFVIARFDPVADEPPNAVNVAEVIKQVKANDAALKVVSL